MYKPSSSELGFFISCACGFVTCGLWGVSLRLVDLAACATCDFRACYFGVLALASATFPAISAALCILYFSILLTFFLK